MNKGHVSHSPAILLLIDNIEVFPVPRNVVFEQIVSPYLSLPLSSVSVLWLPVSIYLSVSHTHTHRLQPHTPTTPTTCTRTLNIRAPAPIHTENNSQIKKLVAYNISIKQRGWNYFYQIRHPLLYNNSYTTKIHRRRKCSLVRELIQCKDIVSTV